MLKARFTSELAGKFAHLSNTLLSVASRFKYTHTHTHMNVNQRQTRVRSDHETLDICVKSQHMRFGIECT